MRPVFLAAVLLGTASLALSDDSPLDSPEQKVLDGFVGTWRTTYELPKAEWTPEEKTGTADLTYARALGGRFVQEQGEHADKSTVLVMYTYDGQRKCYRCWWFSSTGQTTEYTGKWDADAKTLMWTSVPIGGQNFTTIATHRFVNNDTFEWDVTVNDGTGKTLYRVKGTSVRVKEPKK